MKKEIIVWRLDCYIGRVTSFLKFVDSIILFIHSFLRFLAFSPSLSLTGYVHLRTDISYNIYTCRRKKKETYVYVHLRILVCVFPLKTPRTIGSMLNVSLCII